MLMTNKTIHCERTSGNCLKLLNNNSKQAGINGPVYYAALNSVQIFVMKFMNKLL